jgi:hypothetical protein
VEPTNRPRCDKIHGRNWNCARVQMKTGKDSQARLLGKIEMDLESIAASRWHPHWLR